MIFHLIRASARVFCRKRERSGNWRRGSAESVGNAQSDASDNGSPRCETGPRASDRDLWVTAQGLAARSVDREVAPACGSEAVSSITAFGWGPLGRRSRTQRHGRAPRTLTSRGPSPCPGAPCLSELARSSQRRLRGGPGPRHFSTDVVHSPVDKTSNEPAKRWKNLCNKSGENFCQFRLAPGTEREYFLGIRTAHRRSRGSGQPGHQVAEVGSESSTGCRLLRASSEFRGIAGDAVIAAD